jgi:hypothetical protein
MFVSVHRVSVHLLVRVFGSMLDLFRLVRILIFAGYRVNGFHPKCSAHEKQFSES